MKLDGHLSQLGRIRVERPPLLWEVDAAEGDVVDLLDALVSMALRDSDQPSRAVLSLSNITVDPDAAGEELPAGDFVGFTVRIAGAALPDATWVPGTAAAGPIGEVRSAAEAAGVRFAYSRRLERGGSVTVFLPRYAS